ncbi:hypothetical protein [Tautonia rosea]|uniref:hypothetical protein n=1 Tax=Tautonia rosea TaxID=2728037 RepID=UPI00147638DB|nr:hypothetical protein [Tautonia rosea]
MRRFLLSAGFLPLMLLLPILPGCGGGTEVGDIQVSPEAEAADDAGQKAMEEYMKSMPGGQP